MWFEKSNTDSLAQGRMVIFWIGLVLEMGVEWCRVSLVLIKMVMLGWNRSTQGLSDYGFFM